MKIREIKCRMLVWRDFYGQDIAETDLIKKAKTRKQLEAIIQRHVRFLEDQNLDAKTHAENFITFLELK